MEEIKYEALLRTVELGSLTRAGEALGYTQSGISHLLNGLERDCGVQLLHRDRSGVHLTSAGQMLLPYFEEICAHYRDLDLILKEMHGGDRGVLRIATHTSIAGQWLPSIFQKFQEQYPNVKLELLEVITSTEVNELVRKRMVDCGFSNSNYRNPENIFLYRDQLVAVLPPNHELASQKCFPMEQLDKYPYIKLDEDLSGCDNYSACIDEIFVSQGKTPQICFHTRSEYTALSMIAGQQGYSILPNMAKDRTRHQLVYLPLEKPCFRYVSLLVTEGRENILLVKNFIGMVQDWLREKYEGSDMLP